MNSLELQTTALVLSFAAVMILSAFCCVTTQVQAICQCVGTQSVTQGTTATAGAGWWQVTA